MGNLNCFSSLILLSSLSNSPRNKNNDDDNKDNCTKIKRGNNVNSVAFDGAGDHSLYLEQRSHYHINISNRQWIPLLFLSCLF